MNNNKFLVIGDFCIDHFIYGATERINPEAPVPIFKPFEVVENYGMAGNVAENLSSLGHEVDLVCNKNKIFKNKGVLVKYPKKKQDLRIDLPTVGFETFVQCKSVGLKGIILKSKGHSLLDKKKCINFANKNKMFLLTK